MCHFDRKYFRWPNLLHLWLILCVVITFLVLRYSYSLTQVKNPRWTTLNYIQDHKREVRPKPLVKKLRFESSKSFESKKDEKISTKKKMNFIPEKLRSESILDFLKNQTVISMKETQFKSVVRNKLNLDEKNTKESFYYIISTVIYGFMNLLS